MIAARLVANLRVVTVLFMIYMFAALLVRLSLAQNA
jgi:hypothetical protein